METATRLARSPRQRPGFARGALDTPAIDLAASPVLSDIGLRSPSLPVVSPDAPAASQSSPIKNTARKRLPRTHSQAFWLALYFAFNLGLTLYNKGVLVHFPYPYTLTAVHAFCGSLGGYVLRRRRFYTPARLDAKSYAVLAAFSMLYAVNIAVSNISLHLVTIPFHQVVRAATPIFTTVLSAIIFGTRPSSSKLVALSPVILGVFLATYGDYYFTALGFLLTLLGTVLAALKTIYTNVLQSTPKAATRLTCRPTLSSFFSTLLLPPSLNLHPLDLLTRMSPLAFVQCLVYAYLSGEFTKMANTPAITTAAFTGWWRLLLLLGNGCIAFGLNVVSFTANGKVGALNMTVAANVKQVLTIALAVVVFDLTITPTNALGIAIALLGGAWYARVEYQAKARGKTARLTTAQ
ncbi:triose-phosphate transporter family-domain-containing protein [Trametes maxima]|nr:triose-phosphate transporter family-domain-containing protein [Trametes maxima]